MNVTFLVAAIAAAVSITGWFVTSTLSSRHDRRVSQTEALRSHVEKQLSELYGPLAFLVYEGRGTFQDLWQLLGSKSIFRGDRTPTGGELELWLFWVDHDFMPRNEAIQQLLATKTHLIDGETLPASYLAFLDHYNNWRVSHLRWKKDEVPYSWRSKVNWPKQFEEDVIKTFEALLKRHAELVGAVSNTR